MTRVCLLLAVAFLGFAAAAVATEATLFALQAGDDEREFAGGACLQEKDFLAGTVSSAQHLKVGGEAVGCDSEWATSAEFDLGALPEAGPLLSAVLIVRKTGYSDDSAGFAYLGAFAYAATGEAIPIPRSTLTPEKALDILYPPAANVDLSFDVTAAVGDWLDQEATRAGLLLAGVYSEVGYENWISVDGATYLHPPRLVVIFEDPVAIEPTTWTRLKAVYR